MTMKTVTIVALPGALALTAGCAAASFEQDRADFEGRFDRGKGQAVTQLRTSMSSRVTLGIPPGSGDSLLGQR
jgi:hypothetical protein